MNAPHNPLFDVNTTRSTFFSSRTTVYGLFISSPETEELTCANISDRLSEYGRMWVMASEARLNFEAETIFIACVIFILAPTEAILLRISFKLAIFSEKYFFCGITV